MANLLRTLIALMFSGLIFTVLLALKIVHFKFSHIQIAIPFFIYTIFAQAFVMFYFIGVSKLTQNVLNILSSKTNLHELFDEAPLDLESYEKEAKFINEEATRSKRQTVPWSILMLILGMIAFLLGGATDTGLVQKSTHFGVVLGFLSAMAIGFFRQWHYLGKNHLLLRKLKSQFGMNDHAM